MGLALNEADRNTLAVEFYHLLSLFDCMSSTPTLCNAGIFFFQAEDGIREDLVTGVQTCALPISARRLRPRAGQAPGARRRHRGQHPDRRRSEERRVGEECRSRWSPYP